MHEHEAARRVRHGRHATSAKRKREREERGKDRDKASERERESIRNSKTQRRMKKNETEGDPSFKILYCIPGLKAFSASHVSRGGKERGCAFGHFMLQAR